MAENGSQERDFGFLARVTEVGTLFVAVIAGGTALGWIFGVQPITALIPEAPRMAGNSALALVLLCAALWLIRSPVASSRAHAVARTLALLAAALGGLTLLEYVADVEVPVDDLFEKDGASMYPGRMSPHVATVLVGMGLWLIALDRPGRLWRTAANALAPLVGIGVLAALIGWLYGVDYIQGSDGSPGIAPQTSVSLTVMFFAILASRPDTPWMKLVTGPGSGGHLMRRFVPILVIGTIVAGSVLINGVEHDLWDASVGAAFVIACLITIQLAGLIQTSRELEWADIERRGLEARLVALADRDPLTDVFNRRRFDEELRRHFALHQRHGTGVAILSIDLDDFKAINDTYGHHAGDEVLVATADALRHELRASDIVARFGGDEFVVLLPELDAPAAQAVADKLVRAFCAVERWAPDGSKLELRASIGVAHSATAGWKDPDALLIAADKALYAAKREAVAAPQSRLSWVVN